MNVNPNWLRVFMPFGFCMPKLLWTLLHWTSTFNHIQSIFVPSCWTLPHSLIRMKVNPLNPAVYSSSFDLTSQPILIEDHVCRSHNRLWLISNSKDIEPATSVSTEQKKVLDVDLRQFEGLSQIIHAFPVIWINNLRTQWDKLNLNDLKKLALNICKIVCI